MGMTGYEPSAWSDFAVAVAGAAAALSGLLFVAVSINVQRILSFENLPGRAIQALIMLVVPLLISVLLLIPEQPRSVLGTELALLGVFSGVALWRLNGPGRRPGQETPGSWLLSRAVPSATIALLPVLAGVTLIAEAGGGLYWLAPVILIALIAGLVNAWVLLVEILR
jgi:modulator of FtsH protease